MRREMHDEVDPTPWPLALLLGALGGPAALLAFPPYDQWMLLPLAIALLCGGVLVRSPWVAALVSLIWGAGFFIPLVAWANTYAGTPPWIALGVFEALFIVLFGLLARTVMVRRGLGASSTLIIAALWAGVELLRSHVPWGGLPWGASAFALSSSPVLNLGPWIGVSGLAVVMAFLGMLLLNGAMSLTGRRHRGVVGIAGVWPLAVAVALVLTTMVVPRPTNPAPEGRQSMTIAGIQGNTEPVDPATMVMPPGIYQNHLDVSRQVVEDAEAAGEQIDLMVWPEDSTEYDPREDPVRSAQLTELAESAGAPVLVGTQTAVGEDQRLNNSLLYTPDGDVPYVYAKRHPVPFGEYVPHRDFFRTFSSAVDLVGRDMIPGDEVGTMDLAQLGQGSDTVGVLICFEIAYDTLVADVVDGGAEVIVVQSNNALFGDSDEAVQQLAEARVMSVVSGRSIVHLSTVGDSAIFTPDGRVLSTVGHWEQGSMLADVPLRTGITPAMQGGPWIGIALAAFGVIGWIGAMTTRRRAVRTVAAAREARRGRDSMSRRAQRAQRAS